LERPTRVGPFKRLRQDVVEVTDEGNEAITQVFERREAGPLQKSASQDGKPDLDLVKGSRNNNFPFLGVEAPGWQGVRRAVYSS